MSLVDSPKDTSCQICSIPYMEESLKYMKVGIIRGANVRVICRHPDDEPRLIEIELENSLLVSLPFSFAKEVVVKVSD